MPTLNGSYGNESDYCHSACSQPSNADDRDLGEHVVTVRVIGSVLRRSPRTAAILRALSRYGLIRAFRGRGPWPAPPAIRAVFEQLGIVFIKFGQVLAVRRDLIPDAYADELEKLHDRLPPVPFVEITRTVEAALAGPLRNHFSSFDEAPLGSASIAQVHKARLPDDRLVVVKVRRRGLEEQIREDTAILADLAELADQYAASIRASDPVALVDAFSKGLAREMDFRLEAQTIRRFRTAARTVTTLWIPDVVPELSGSTVLVMEHSPGTRIDDYARRFPNQRTALAKAVAELLLHQVFESGLFHADPHPGNLFVLPDGRLCLHDFGAIGELDQPTREGLAALLGAAVSSDARAAADAFFDLGLVADDADRKALESELAAILRQLHDRPLAELSIGEVLKALLRVGARHHMRNPGAILLLARAFLIGEALMTDLDPTLNVIEIFGGELKRLATSRYAPARLAATARRLSQDVERFVEDAPSDLRRSLRRIADGELGRIHAPGIEETGQRLTRGLERMTGAVACAAFLVAGSLLIVAGGWHRPLGDILLFTGIAGSLAVAIGALRER